MRALLLSGGMDSVALAYWLRPEYAVTIDYGQRPAQAEMRAAEEVARLLSIRHVGVHLPAACLGSGDLSDRPPLPIAPKSEWWPYRNQLLVTAAAAAMIHRGVKTLLIGCLRTDGHHADGTPAFVDTLSVLLKLQEGGMELEAPAIGMTAAELIRSSGVPLAVLGWAHSCHTANQACGTCGGCIKHYRTMAEVFDLPY